MPPPWLQHPVTVFLIPLITFLCLPNLYKFLPYITDPSYDETRLQRIADRMDDIYTTLADATFIPHNAITRGPHVINKTALPCTPSASVLRLMELLPYVDSSLVNEPDWIYGGHFMDYRNPEHTAELCDPCRGRGFDWTDYMSPSDIGLTNWGTGGWNGDRSWVMIYDTERDAIRIYEGELFYDPFDGPARLEKCVSNKNSERFWVDLAYHQSEAEALAHCDATGNELLPFETVMNRTRNKIAALEKMVVDEDAGVKRLQAAYKDKLLNMNEKIHALYSDEESALGSRRRYAREQVEALKEQMAKLERGEGKERGRKWLFDCLGDEEKCTIS